MARRGAGGSDGGTGSFLIGLIMMIGGGYLLLRGITVRPQFGLGSVAFSFGTFQVTSGLIMIPFMFGVGLIFYNSRNWIGWILACGSLVALVFGAIASINFEFSRMSAFDLIIILTLLVGGIGLFLRSLRDSRR